MSETKSDKVDEILEKLQGAFISSDEARAALAELVEGIPHDKNSADFNYALKQAADLLRCKSK